MSAMVNIARAPNIRFYADVVYTNTPPAGAFRGYGVPQGYWPLDRHMEKIARAMGFDPIEFRLKNAIHPGEYHPFSTAWNEGREPRPRSSTPLGWNNVWRKASRDWLG
jgi:putative selenate reductase molybdopterin-binding subunit